MAGGMCEYSSSIRKCSFLAILSQQTSLMLTDRVTHVLTQECQLPLRRAGPICHDLASAHLCVQKALRLHLRCVRERLFVCLFAVCLLLTGHDDDEASAGAVLPSEPLVQMCDMMSQHGVCVWVCDIGRGRERERGKQADDIPRADREKHGC